MRTIFRLIPALFALALALPAQATCPSVGQACTVTGNDSCAGGCITDQTGVGGCYCSCGGSAIAVPSSIAGTGGDHQATFTYTNSACTDKVKVTGDETFNTTDTSTFTRTGRTPGTTPTYSLAACNSYYTESPTDGTRFSTEDCTAASASVASSTVYAVVYPSVSTKNHSGTKDIVASAPDLSAPLATGTTNDVWFWSPPIQTGFTIPAGAPVALNGYWTTGATSGPGYNWQLYVYDGTYKNMCDIQPGTGLGMNTTNAQSITSCTVKTGGVSVGAGNYLVLRVLPWTTDTTMVNNAGTQIRIPFEVPTFMVLGGGGAGTCTGNCGWLGRARPGGSMDSKWMFARQ